MFSEHALPQQGNALNMQINSQQIHTHIICYSNFLIQFSQMKCVFWFFTYSVLFLYSVLLKKIPFNTQIITMKCILYIL